MFSGMGRPYLKKVTLGAYYDNRVEILAGLEDQDQVITNPQGSRAERRGN